MVQKMTRRLVLREISDQAEDGGEDREVDGVAPGQQDRLAAHVAVQFQESDDRAREGDRANRDAKAHLDPAGVVDALGSEDPERIGIEIGGRADQHRGHADEAVEGGDELRHRRHLDAPRGDEADRAADGDGGDDFGQAGDLVDEQRRADGDRHADHAEPVAPLAGGRARQPAQGEDEADTGDEIGDEDPGRGRDGSLHPSGPSSCTSPAFVRSPRSRRRC